MKKVSKIVIILLVCLIVASSVSLGNVFAYFSSKSSASGSVTMGHLSIGDIKKSDGTDVDWNIGNLQPNQSFGGNYKVTVDSNINYYIRILFKAKVTTLTGKTHADDCGDNVTDPTDILDIEVDGSYFKSSNKTSNGYTAYYKLEPRQVTASQTTETFSVDLKVHDWVGANYCDYYMGASVLLNIQVQVAQADYINEQASGENIADATTAHSLWRTVLNDGYAVTINHTNTFSGEDYWDVGFYYAVDGETQCHSCGLGETELGVKQKILLLNYSATATELSGLWAGQSGEWVDSKSWGHFVPDIGTPTASGRVSINGETVSGSVYYAEGRHLLIEVTQDTVIDIDVWSS